MGSCLVVADAPTTAGLLTVKNINAAAAIHPKIANVLRRIKRNLMVRSSPCFQDTVSDYETICKIRIF